MYRVFLAGRYMLSRPISYLAMVAIGVAVMALITVLSIMTGFLEETRNVIRGTTADIIVSPFSDPSQPASRARLEDIARQQPGVVGACSRYVRPAIFKIRNSHNFSMDSSRWAQLNQVLVLGLDPVEERGVTAFYDYLLNVESAGNAVDDADHPFSLNRGEIRDGRLRNADLPRVLLGEDLMTQLRLEKGMAIDLITVPDGQDLFGNDVRQASETFIVAGAFRTGRYENDTKELYIERDRFRKWINAQSEVSEVYVTVEEGADLDAVRDDLDVAYRAADMLCQVETWEDRHHVFLGAVENERTILGTVLFFFVLLTCTITFSMVSMMVQEKIRDIGILAAMGASPGGIGFLFGLCAVFVAAMGSLFGLATGTLVVLNVNAVEDFIAAIIGQPIFRKDVYAFTEIPAKLDTPLNLQIVGATIVFAVIICGFPALRAGRMDPVEALRHE